jgi:hypothetical protein
MRKAIATISVALLAVAGATYAAQEKAAPEPAKKSAAQRVDTIKGTVKTFDAATNTLTISTAKGVDQSFVLEPKAALHEGTKAIAAADLSTLAGREATIRYMAAEGQKRAESVMVSTAKPAATSGTIKPAPTGEAGKPAPAPAGKEY